MALILSIDLLVVAVLVGIALSKGVERALPFAAFVIVLVPLESVIPLPGLFDLTTQRVVIVTLAALYLFLGKNAESTKLTSTPLKYLLILSVAWTMLSTMNSAVFTAGFKVVLSQALDFCLLYCIVVRSVSRVETVNKILLGIVAAMAVTCVFGLIEAYRQWPVVSIFPPVLHRFGTGNPLSVDLSRGLRVHSTYPAHELFGSALAMAIPLAHYLIAIAKSSKRKTLLWLVVLLMVWNLYKTASRGPWLAWPIAMIPLCFHRQMRKHLLVIILLTLSVIIIRPGIYDFIKGQYSTTLDPDSPEHGTFVGRFELVRFGYQSVSKDFGRMLWGYGPESWDSMGFEEVWENGSIHPVLSVDSTVAGFLQSTGYVGTLIMFLMLAKPAIFALRNFRKAREPDNVPCLSLCGAMLAFLFMTTNVAIYGWGQQGFWIFILMALSMGYPNWARTDLTSQETISPHPVEHGYHLARMGAF